MKNLLVLILLSATILAHGQSAEVGLRAGINDYDDWSFGAYSKPDSYIPIISIYSNYKMTKIFFIDVSVSYFAFNVTRSSFDQYSSYYYSYNYKNYNLNLTLQYQFLNHNHFHARIGPSLAPALERSITKNKTTYNNPDSTEGFSRRGESYTFLLGAQIYLNYNINSHYNINFLSSALFAVISYNNTPYYGNTYIDISPTSMNILGELGIGYIF